jgi:hypothetical protein
MLIPALVLVDCFAYTLHFNLFVLFWNTIGKAIFHDQCRGLPNCNYQASIMNE